MKKDTVVSIDEAASKDALTDVLREGAQNLLRLQPSWRSSWRSTRCSRTGREGSESFATAVPRREIQTGLGAVSIQIPRVRDRGIEHGTEEAVRFHSCLVPPYLKRSKSLDELLPLL